MTAIGQGKGPSIWSVCADHTTEHFGVFTWAVKEGYLEGNPMDGIVLNRPQSAPIEPYCRERIDCMLSILDHDWQVATTPRQRMRATRDKAILLLFVESGLTLDEMAKLRLWDIRSRKNLRLS